MKLIFLLISSFSFFLSFQNSIYSLQFESIDSEQISMSSYQGKKILVAEFNPATSDKNLLITLDSLQKNNGNKLAVIVVPALDFGATINIQDVQNLKNSMHLSFVITKPAKVKKNSTTAQHPLFKWLTSVTENTHFDKDVEGESEIFVISEKGTLYSVLGKNPPTSFLKEVVNQQTSE